MKKEIKDLLIIGAGPVGLYAWSCAGLLDLDGYIIENHDCVGGQPTELYPEKEIYDIPGSPIILTSEFMNNLTKQAKHNGKAIELFIQTNIVSYKQEEDHFIITLSNQKTIKVKTILITSGNGSFTPRRLDINVKANNLFYQMGDINRFIDKNIVVLGGGDSALDWANYFAEHGIGKAVSIVHRRELYRAKDSSVVKLNKSGVVQYKPYTLKKVVVNEQSMITKLLLANNNDHSELTLECNAVLVQYGAIITPSCINKWPLIFSDTNKVVVEYGMKTNIHGVFAAGNAIYYPNKYYNMTTGFGEAVTALYNITRVINGEKYNPGYLGYNKSEKK